jgi:hypothetical protein
MKAGRFFCGLVFLLICGVVLAQSVPHLINYQGRLTDDTGMPIDGTREMRFRILDADTLSASVLWSETHSSVQVDQGIYHVLLGSVNPIPPSAMSQADIFLEVRVAGEILRPRSQITSVPFAHKAASVPDSSITSAMIADGTITGSDIDSQTITNANIADGTITSTQIQDGTITGLDVGDTTLTGSDIKDDSLGADQIQDIYVLNTGDTVSGALQVDGGAYLNGPTQGAYITWSPDMADHYAYLGSESRGIYARSGSSSEAANRYGGEFHAYGQSNTTGVFGMGHGYGTQDAYGVQGQAFNNSTGPAWGGYFTTSTNGSGTHYGIGAIANSNSAGSAYGVYAGAYNSLSGTATGGYFYTDSSGTGRHYAIYGYGNGGSSSDTYGVVGSAANSSTGPVYGGSFTAENQGTGPHYGVSGSGSSNSDSNAIGSYGFAANYSTGNAYGGFFTTSSDGTGPHYGVYSWSNSGSSSNSYGVYGRGDNTSTGNAYGGYFYTSAGGSGTHYGVFSSADDYSGWFQNGSVHVGNAGVVDYATSDGDIYVEDALEVDGVAYFSGGIEAPGAIDSSDIANGTITSTQIQDSSITGADLQNDSLGTDQIQDIYVLNTGDTVTGDLQVNGNQSIGLDLRVSGENIGLGVPPDNSYGILNDSGSAPAYGAMFYGSSEGIRGAWSGGPAAHYGYLGTESYGVLARAGDSSETVNKTGGYFSAYSQAYVYGAYGNSYGYGAYSSYGVRGKAFNSSTGYAFGGYFEAATDGTGMHFGVYAKADDYAGWFQDGSVHIGNSGVQDYATSDGDLYVEDALEVDGDAHFSGDIDAPGAIDSSDVAPSAIMAVNIGEDCALGEVLAKTTLGWQCRPPGGAYVWTWMSGDNVTSQNGIYGTKGIPDQANVPGSRRDAVSWIDASGNLWLFGGNGYPASGGSGELNDLWRWDGINWTWISGSDAIDQNGVYGTKGTPNPANVPGSRNNAISWAGLSGNLWLFGGWGYPASGGYGYLNDLWRWDGTNWTWMSGSDLINQNGNYGTKGWPTSTNVPGSRREAVSWIDSSGNFWLFGGWGYPASGEYNRLNDLWRWDGTYWTWMSGSNAVNQYGVYGTKGTPDPANVPGARFSAVSWIEASGNKWLFGGSGYGASGSPAWLNDLWRWDGTNWTWMSGSDWVNQYGVYGTKGTPDSANVPGSREDAVSWTDSSGILWLSGGNGMTASGAGYLNDLWRWDGTNWTWISGSDISEQNGVYGIKGSPDQYNVPGSRERAISWTDKSGNFWLFGGWGYDGSGGSGYLNDLWRFK